MAEHTTGTWTALLVQDDEWGVYAESGRLGPGQTTPDLRIVAVGLTEPEARLIAAAPDLLAGLDKALSWFGRMFGDPGLSQNPDIEAMCSAVAKARGEADS